MKLSTQDYGSGERRIALVHGLSASGELWRSLIDRMLRSGDVTVTTVDLRGHGLSPRAGRYTVADFADDLVETLPVGLDAIVAHSLGGAVLERAVARLRPRRAVYLDPGFALALPTRGVRGRLFWTVAPVALTFAALGQKRKARGRAPLAPSDAALVEIARGRFDRSMSIRVFRDVAFHPVPVAPPAVPSVIVLSDDSPAVLPEAAAAALAQQGWELRHLAGVGHDFWLEDADRTWAAIADAVET